MTGASADVALEEQLERHVGKSMPLPDFLQLFDERVRDPQSTLRITHALESLGLTTAPFFATCSRSSQLTIIRVQDQPEQAEAESVVTAPPWSARLADLVRDRDGFPSVTAATSLQAAVVELAQHGNLPLPVLSGNTTVRGVLTWRSLATAFATKPDPTLAKAVQSEDLPILHVSNDVFAALPLVREHGFVLVGDQDNTIKWLLTAADIIDRFEQIARPHAHLSEIEHMLHKLLGGVFTAEEIRGVQSYERTGRIEDCVFGDYLKLIRPPERWARLQWIRLDHVLFLEKLRQVKDVRNKVQHFHAISPEELLVLAQFKGMLKGLI